ncbi:MAG: hypothetical protein IH944_10575 [Armatimonadetes bacterium]|nr:hypothetical protein [Armatimonadota bacterium]
MEFERFSPSGELIEVRTTWFGDRVFGVVQGGGAIAGYGWAFWSIKALEADQSRAYQNPDFISNRAIPYPGAYNFNEAGQFTPDYRGVLLILTTLAIVHLVAAAGLFRGSRFAMICAVPLAFLAAAYAYIDGGISSIAAVAAILCALYSLGRLFGWIGPKAERIPTEG